MLVRTRTQTATALALVDLDGVARRLILCPPELTRRQILDAAAIGEVDAVVTDESSGSSQIPQTSVYAVSERPAMARAAPLPPINTEWVLMTSGTTGTPKLVVHSLSSLSSAIGRNANEADERLWGTFYDIRRYGGLQILLRALAGEALVLPGPDETQAQFLQRAGALGITHISGTPSHWRCALVCKAERLIGPRYIRLSGEIVDQSLLDKLKTFFPSAMLVHAFASTEAGVAFEVTDGQEGFPEEFLRDSHAEADIRVENGTLCVRSNGAAARILGGERAIRRPNGFVDTGDAVEQRDHRFYFVGRKDRTINVGGNKVHPEEVEAVIAKHPDVEMARASMRRNPILGAVVEAEIVLRAVSKADTEGDATQDILDFCKARLDRHKVPAFIRIVTALPLTAGGKMDRNHV
ncbi:MAG TPA: class I adenylate-forming enzyme family protein [Rhizomicrobium sp.]|nr:class I adenylate-forming enzyme family protein [Rhizomicrobium sp.]